MYVCPCRRSFAAFSEVEVHFGYIRMECAWLSGAAVGSNDDNNNNNNDYYLSANNNHNYTSFC